VNNKTLSKVFLTAATLVAACAVSTNVSAHAGVLPDIDPEIAATVWEEETQTCASVSLNGKDLVTYKGVANGRTAEQRAEELAAKLKDVVGDNKLDATKLLPGKDGDLASIKIDGNTILKFDSLSSDNKNALEQSFKMVNSLRSAMGALPIPASFLKLTDGSGKDLIAAKGKGTFSGHASWYGPHFHGKMTSDGSRFDQDGMTAAHKTLPFGTKLLVTNRSTGKSCVVEVNDRGPFVGDRVIDLSRGAAKQLNMMSSGVALVDCLVLGKD
jgi:rare lipoprotein A